MTGNALKVIHDAIAAAVKAAGFSKKGASWYADRGEAILLIAPQKSQHGQRFFMNLGIFFPEIGSARWPKSNECHLQARLEDVVDADCRPVVDAVLDFDRADVSDEARVEKIADLLARFALPFVEGCSTLSGVRAAEKRGVLKALPMLRSLRERL